MLLRWLTADYAAGQYHEPDPIANEQSTLTISLTMSDQWVDRYLLPGYHRL